MELQRALEKKYNTDVDRGLTSEQARDIRARVGKNALPEGKQESWLMVFLRQFQSPLIYLLLVAAIIIYFFGQDRLDAFIISGVLLFNAIVGTIQEGRTRTILHSLKAFVTTTSVVVRNGEKLLVADEDIVPGDIVILTEGARVPADAYVIVSQGLQLDEAMLTGESHAVSKCAIDQCDEAHKQEQQHMVFKGTYVLTGSGKALVFATGVQTKIGSIAVDVQTIKTDMPLKEDVDRLSYQLLFVVLAICGMLFVIGWFAGQPAQELLVMLTALFICVVPEGLPVVMTLVLVSGVYRMAQQKVFVKDLQAVEGLGRTDVIVIDKTGTLTRNELMVCQVSTRDEQCTVSGQGYHADGYVLCNGKALDKLRPGEYDQLYHMSVAAILLNSAEITYQEGRHTFDIKGDPTEAALSVFAQKMGFNQDDLSQQYTKLYEIPFDAKRQYHAAFFAHEIEQGSAEGLLYIIGAPEQLFTFVGAEDVAFLGQLKQMLSRGLRVIALASKRFDLQDMPSGVTQDVLHDIAMSLVHNGGLKLMGLYGIADAIRSDAADMIDKATKAGLQVVMATGDHKDTARYVAKAVGIFADGDTIVTGGQLDHMSDEELIEQLPSIRVFARLQPEQKLRLVRAYHAHDQIVAMTGDGINDAPALVAADLGIAMGGIGTEVAKQAADIILLDDAFSSIIRAIAQGRHIFYTLKRVILYFFATNFGEVLIVMFALVLNAFDIDFPLPLTAAQILWLNLVTDGFLDVAISMEPQEQGLLAQSWLRSRMKLIDRAMVGKIIFYSLPMAVGSLWVFLCYYQADLALARTMTLVTMAMYQWFNAWNCRSARQSLLSIGLLSNRWLLVATSFVLLLQFALLYVPWMQYIFKTVPLSVEQWGLIIAITAPIVLLDELRKWIVRMIKVG